MGHPRPFLNQNMVYPYPPIAYHPLPMLQEVCALSILSFGVRKKVRSKFVMTNPNVLNRCACLIQSKSFGRASIHIFLEYRLNHSGERSSKCFARYAAHFAVNHAKCARTCTKHGKYIYIDVYRSFHLYFVTAILLFFFYFSIFPFNCPTFHVTANRD